MSKYRVKCDRHGRIYGYVICLCLLKAPRLASHIVHPDKEATDARQLGELTCGKKHSVDDLTLICERCAVEKGFVPKSA